jgi:uncharacterized membrane protein
MQCPLCSTTLPAEVTTCPGCGTNLGLLLTVQTLQLDLQRAREHSVGMAARLDHLQERLAHLGTLVHTDLVSRPATTSAAAATAPAVSAPDSGLPQSAQQTAPPAPQVRASAAAAEPPPVLSDGAELRFGQKWLLIAGVAITVLGIGFFLKYAFDQNWVGPAGRVALGYLAAVAFLGVGEAFRRRAAAATFGLYLTGGGLATLYLTTFAAFQVYALFGQVSAFGLLVLVTLLACLLALAYDTQWLAVLGLIGGFMTPVILSTGQNAQIMLMSYMTLLNAGILAIAAWKRWPLLNALGCGCTWLLFTGWFVRHYTEQAFWPTMVFLHIFFLIYALVPFLYYFVHESRAHLPGLTLTSLNTLVTFSYAFGMVRSYTSLPVVSVLTLAYAGIFFGMASFLYRRHPENLAPFTLLLAKGLLFLILTVPLLVSGHWITLFWAVQAAVILWAGLRLQHRWLSYGALALLLLALGKLVLYDYDVVFALRLETLAYTPGFTTLLLERWSVLAGVLGALLYCARRLATADTVLGEWQDTATAWLYGTFATLLFFVLTIEVSAWCYEQARQARFAAISVLWTLFSIALMLLGFRYQQVRLRLVSLGLFGVTVLKVFLADMANVSTPFRIVSFVVLGLMLIGASYLYYRYRGSLLSTAALEDRP